MDKQQLTQALEQYHGDMDSLKAFVDLVESQMGPDWMAHIYGEAKGMPAELREKLEHAINYYGGTVAWNEIQGYLEQDVLSLKEVKERVPVLAHWLSFFGTPGTEVLDQLKNKIAAQEQHGALAAASVAEQGPTEPVPADQEAEQEFVAAESVTESEPVETPAEPVEEAEPNQEVEPETVQTPTMEEPDYSRYQPKKVVSHEEVVEEETQPVETPEIQSAPVLDAEPAMVAEPDESVAEFEEEPAIAADITESEPVAVVDQMPVDTADAPVLEQPVAAPESDELSTNDPNVFLMRKISKELDFLHAVQSWVSARCVALGNIETYAYPNYGFVMDVYQQILADIETALSDDETKRVFESHRPGFVGELTATQKTVQAELDFAEEMIQKMPTPVLKEGVTREEAAKTLGLIDESTGKEYLGPAPDGFEALDDPYETSDGELNEEKLKSDYAVMEEKNKDIPNLEMVEEKNDIEKTVAKTPQSGVERKISISLGVKPIKKKI